jgi:predicted negative regulator of RcsB-dependent stress response
MTKRSRKTPQMVSVNRVFLIIGLLGMLAMVSYFYWDKNQRQKSVNTQQIQH